MAASLIASSDPRLPHLLRLPPVRQAASLLEEVRLALAAASERQERRGELRLLAEDWRLPLPELRAVQLLLESHDLALTRVCSELPETRVAAEALGLVAEAPARGETASGDGEGGLRIHRGTLRSGEHLQSEGSLLLLGDLNPGARISAAGDIFVWGRLRGVAHAGCRGDESARIVALQLRPLQLRIAAAVARGPEERPAAGLAEQARLVAGMIRIDPADPMFPAVDRPEREERSHRA